MRWHFVWRSILLALNTLCLAVNDSIYVKCSYQLCLYARNSKKKKRPNRLYFMFYFPICPHFQFAQNLFVFVVYSFYLNSICLFLAHACYAHERKPIPSKLKWVEHKKSTNCVCTKWIQSKVSSVRCIKKCRANCFNPQQKRTNEHTQTHTP